MEIFGRLWFFLWLLAVPISTAEGTQTTSAADSIATRTSLLKIWKVDKSCNEELEYMENSMSVALDIVTAAHSALKFMREKAPDRNKDESRYQRWATIYKSVQVFLGFLTNTQPNYLNELIDLFDKMERIIPSQENPERICQEARQAARCQAHDNVSR
ncbi:uncharacterized protein FPRO_12252 [Fusarium proliferatum ET1]|uniref:Secreted protein n=1 Tax=Fusarium proliferatum (strain ET1) TaxID=1227346 RepID=A0A1L7W3A7_FUSPR|nr:uncharacterized protein FPRO_12252 [Fusarium proliferatum ET1]CZR46801.1 uncharacterized protein FPRO_12252 [Fusarium proliferatum ET1]